MPVEVEVESARLRIEPPIGVGDDRTIGVLTGADSDVSAAELLGPVEE